MPATRPVSTYEVISGHEEARLIQLGVLQALPVFDRRLLLIDVGGGSTEVLLGWSGAATYVPLHQARVAAHDPPLLPPTESSRATRSSVAAATWRPRSRR